MSPRSPLIFGSPGLSPGRETLGLAYGLLGVACFSLTLPATVLALEAFDPMFVGLGRAALAGLLAGGLLWLTGQRRPRRDELGGLAITALGVVFGFPVLASWAMQYLPAAHGGVVLGVLPLLTAAAGALIGQERPSFGFWLVGCLGSATVVVFALLDGAEGLHLADLALLGGVILAALGYAQGARSARHLGGWQTICWVLVLALPLTLPYALWRLAEGLPSPDATALAGFLYVALFSQLLGFFAWYRGLILGGVARVSQVQLLQPFLTLLGAWLLLGETISATTLGFAVLVVGWVALGRRMPIRQT
jgi:drug/metabolite transporter (DMT)-like permease